MTAETDKNLLMLRANLEELQRAYGHEPSDELLTAIFQLQVAVQQLESNQEPY